MNSTTLSEYNMAQSEKIGRTALGFEPFWDKLSSNPTISWEKWRSQLKMALVATTNVELDELLQKRQTRVIYPPPPEPVEEQTVQNPTQTMERERMADEVPSGNSQMKKRM